MAMVQAPQADRQDGQLPGRPPEEQPMTSESAPIEWDNKAIVQEAFDAWAAGGESVLKLLADDATWTLVGNSPVSATYHSRQAFVDTVVRPLYARLATPVVPKV